MSNPTRKRERLPPGFLRTEAGSLRVQIRITGHKPVVRTFPIFEDSPDARRRQLDDATAWAVDTRRRLKAGNLVDTRQAETTTLGTVLERYERDGLKGKDSNAQKDRNRIRQIMSDPIAMRPVIGLKKSDVAAYRERLIAGGRAKSLAAATRRLDEAGGPSADARKADLRRLEGMRSEAASAGPARRRALEREISEIQVREGVKEPARTTISNKIQLITRALGLASETMEGVPDLTGVPMPSASAGRDRRVSAVELTRLLERGAAIHPLLPLVVRFAIATALRRERIFEFCEQIHVVQIGAGKAAIAFPRDATARRKRTGIIPVTREIRGIIDEAVRFGSELAPTGDGKGRTTFPINPVTFDHLWRRLVLECELDGLHFHDLRHEATSRLFERGLSVAEVMSITGHSTTDMVDRYSHYSASLVLDKLDGRDDPERLLAEIKFLMDQYASMTGRVVDGAIFRSPEPRPHASPDAP